MKDFLEDIWLDNENDTSNEEVNETSLNITETNFYDDVLAHRDGIIVIIN